MATASSGSMPVTATKVAVTGAVVFWSAARVLRQKVADAVSRVGITTLPPIDHYDALVETGKAIVEKCVASKTGCPVKHDSLSRSAVGVEFVQTTKGDKANSREFLFSIGVDKSNTAFVKQVGNHANVNAVLTHPGAEQALNALYQYHLQFMPSRDVTDSLTGLVMQNRGIRMNDGKGVFFVPDSGLATVDSVFAAMNGAGCRCTMLLNDLSDNETLCKQVLEATNEQLVESLAAMQEEMSVILSDDKKKPRINGLQTKMKQLAQYTDTLEYYQRMFGDNLDASSKALTMTFEMLSELQIRYKGDSK
jgi:hypothetical protein